MANKLAPYLGKRDFAQTSEPRGKTDVAPAANPRFVVQKHAASRLHYDLRLEHQSVFKSWAVTKGPSCDPHDKRLAVEVEDHPLDYGDFEGTVPEGQYGAGTVMLWDRGFWIPDDDAADVEAALKQGELKFTLAGEKLKGSWVLVRMKGRGGHNWLLMKHRDEFACKGSMLAHDRSVASGRTMDQITAGKGRKPKMFMAAGAKTAVPPAILHAGNRKKVAATTHRRTRRKNSAAVLDIEISKPEKELWPAAGGSAAVKKLDLARYLESVGPWMIGHLKGRPCSIIRAPDSVDRETWIQRHVPKGVSGYARNTKVEGGREAYLQIDCVEGLIVMAQIAAVEFHPWNCAPNKPAVPGRLVFDLDPGLDVAFLAVVDAAKELHERLQALGLISFCKTTGGKGLHVVTPLKATGTSAVGWDQAKAFAKALCTAMAGDSSNRYLVGMAKKSRKGRIFLDYLRNDRTATAVAPLSPRAHSSAPVAMPLNWSELRTGFDPLRFTIGSAPDLLARNRPWQDYGKAERPLGPAIRKLDAAL